MSDNFYIFRRLFQVGKIRNLIEPGERTPYPIIIENPTLRDALFNMGLPEWVPFLVSVPIGVLLGYYLSHPLRDLPLTRRKAFTGVVFSVVTVGWYLGFKGSVYKLVGFEDNGLRWKRPEERVKKYVFTDGMDGFWEDLLKAKDR